MSSTCAYTDYLSSSGGDLGSPDSLPDDDCSFSDSESSSTDQISSGGSGSIDYLSEFFSPSKNGAKSGSQKPGGRTKSGRKPCKYVPHADKPTHVVDKRNARERRRVEAVNSAFVRLRKVVPHENRRKRISKVKTLKVAMDYIQYLQDMIDDHDKSQRLQAMAAEFQHHSHAATAAHHHYNPNHPSSYLQQNHPSMVGHGHSPYGTPPHPAYLHHDNSPPLGGGTHPTHPTHPAAHPGGHWDPSLQHPHLQGRGEQTGETGVLTAEGGRVAGGRYAPSTGSPPTQATAPTSCLQQQQPQPLQHPAVPQSLYYPQESLMPGYTQQSVSSSPTGDTNPGWSMQQQKAYSSL